MYENHESRFDRWIATIACRRSATCIAILSLVIFGPSIGPGQMTDLNYSLMAQGKWPFGLIPLPYPFNALEPYLAARTVETHYKTNHGNLVKRLDQTIARDYGTYVGEMLKYRGSPEPDADWEYPWLARMLADSSKVSPEFRTQFREYAGGLYNHFFFWQMMKTNGGGKPKGELAKALDSQFGSFDAFKRKFSDAAKNLSGNGWAWLTLDRKALRIETTPNEETPVSSGREVLLGIDLWDHAYSLQYQNRRADYVAAWWNVVNWDFVAGRYEAAIRK
jgi:Fe-Mn family superoxide dismutase